MYSFPLPDWFSFSTHNIKVNKLDLEKMQEEKRRPMWSETTLYQQDQLSTWMKQGKLQLLHSSLGREWKSLDSVWLCNPMDYTVHGILQAKILEWVTFRFSRRSCQLRDWTRSPTLQVDSEPQGKPKSTGVGSLSPSPEVLLTHDSNQGLLHCRWVLYQLSSEGRLGVYSTEKLNMGPPELTMLEDK